MMRAVSALMVVGLGACTPKFESFDEACMPKTPGQASFDAGEDAPAVKMVHRVNCWRRLAGTRRVRVEKQLSDAAEAHASYTEINGFEATDGGLFEDPSLPGYTGADPISRGEAFGYDWGARSIAFWESTSPDAGIDAVTYADLFLHEPYGRQALLQPGLHGVGYGRSGEWAVSEWHYDWPTNAHTERPVVWPLEDASNVPISAPFLDDDLVTRNRGYVITATVGSDKDADLGSLNPYQLVLNDFSLSGPDGEVTAFTLTPDNASGAFLYSVAIVPNDPLAVNTTYDVSMDIAWDDEDKTLAWSFTTGDTEIVF